MTNYFSNSISWFFENGFLFTCTLTLLQCICISLYVYVVCVMAVLVVLGFILHCYQKLWCILWNYLWYPSLMLNGLPFLCRPMILHLGCGCSLGMMATWRKPPKLSMSSTHMTKAMSHTLLIGCSPFSWHSRRRKAKVNAYFLETASFLNDLI